MQLYRVYIMDPKGYVESPPELIECADNDAAIGQARQYLDGKPVEIWEDGRRIARLEPEA